MPLTVTAGAQASAGFYAVTISGKAGNGAVLANASILVTVAAPGQVIPTAYVSNYSDNTVTPVDRANDTAGPVIPVGSGPDGVAVTPNGAEVYVANNNSNNVSVISTATNQVIATVPVGSVAADVTVTPDGKTVWVTNYGDGTVQPIDVATHTAGDADRGRREPGAGRDLSQTASTCGSPTRALAQPARSTCAPARSRTR